MSYFPDKKLVVKALTMVFESKDDRKASCFTQTKVVSILAKTIINYCGDIKPNKPLVALVIVGKLAQRHYSSGV